jgi:hypothetical protein
MQGGSRSRHEFVGRGGHPARVPVPGVVQATVVSRLDAGANTGDSDLYQASGPLTERAETANGSRADVPLSGYGASSRSTASIVRNRVWRDWNSATLSFNVERTKRRRRDRELELRNAGNAGERLQELAVVPRNRNIRGAARRALRLACVPMSI